MTTDQARDKTNYKGTQNVWRLSFKRIKKEEKNHDDCWAAKTRQKEKTKITMLGCWKSKREKKKITMLDCRISKKEKKTITMLGYLKSKRENYHVGLPERKEG